MKAPMTKLGPPDADREDVNVDGMALRLALGWNRGEDYQPNPALATMLTSTAVENHILHGWLPDEPLIDPSAKVLALGSCFAQNFANHLLERQYRLPNGGEPNAHVMRIHAGMATSFSIRQHLEWALEGKTFDQSLWDGFDVEALGF
ncbi:MAG: GSCFA domain-containing protein, partial [Holophagales bacterium]|nr:GSCFA domain-containing protein [Holophagales bacterium]